MKYCGLNYLSCLTYEKAFIVLIIAGIIVTTLYIVRETIKEIKGERK